MTTAERTAYDLGVKAAVNAAQIVALSIECAPDASTFQKKIAAETLAAFAESAKGLMLAVLPDANHEVTA